MSLDLLRPLILETASQVLLKSPKALQTGPAVRKDEKVIGRHLDYLKETPEYQRLYELLTKSIQNSFKAS